MESRDAEVPIPGDDAVGYPRTLGFERLKHQVKPDSQVSENAIMIVGVAVSCVQGRSRSPHEHRVGNQLLQKRRGFQHG